MNLSQILYRAARSSRDVNAIKRAVKTRSVRPLFARIGNRLIGRLVARCMHGVWFR